MRVRGWSVFLAAAAAAVLLPPTPAGACSTAADCQLNGVCSGGACRCDPAWLGDDCSTLNLVPPESIVAAYPPPSLANTTSSWGGSVLRDDSGKYHMFAAAFSNSCGLNSWTTNSVIVSAVSDKPEGPYEPNGAGGGVIMGAFSHNPVVTRAADGTYVIHHIGCGTPNGGVPPCTDCSKGTTGASCQHPGETVACSGNTTNLLFSKSLDGPWQQLNAPIVRAGSGIPPSMGKYGVDNPSPIMFPNGSVLMLGRDDWNSVGRIVAPGWRGPYTLQSLVGPAPYTVEDPFLYRDPRGAFHALFHGGPQGGGYSGAGAHAFSTDGGHWTFSASPAYSTAVNTSDGRQHAHSRRERPHLLFDGEGWPTHLSTSLWVGPADHTVTFVQAIVTAS